MQKPIRKELELAGKKLILETGELATKANGSVLATYGETVVLATAVSQEASADIGYFPLSVDYEEKLYAGGRISTSRFIKRENRPTEEAILTARLIDRSIRPLFPKDFTKEVQIIITVLSVDQENDPDIVSLIATSAALAISDIPWNGPIAGIRVGRQNGGLILNPTQQEKSFSDLDLVLAANKNGEVVMIETAASEVDEKALVEATKLATKEAIPVVVLIGDLQKSVGMTKEPYGTKKLDQTVEKKIRDYIKTSVMKDFHGGKTQDETWFGETLKILEEKFIKEDEENISAKIISNILEEEIANFLREEILINKRRPDGRKPDDIRPITTKVEVLPRTHGSALFARGETQALSIVTLGSPALEQLIEGMGGEETKRYMHHYNFPPFSVGEVRRRGAPARREIGHGALAEKALLPIIPPLDVFPYTIRVVSEILSSAGSTSMASACGSTLALMDAGVPIKEPVAGISIGLITDKNDKSKYVIITDIAYQEDAQGDMDCKVAGTKNGITAIQMDTKLNGVTINILDEALQKAKKARLIILQKILATMPTSREKISKHAPTVILVKIDPAKIGDVIGSGGRTINRIIAETGAAIDINDEGIVTISSKDREACKKAAEWVESIVKEAKPGEVYEGKVKRILPFGAMVEILPGKEGLVHISQLAPHRVEKVEDVVKIGQPVKVRVVEIDDQGRVNLSMVFGDDIKNKPHRFQDRAQRGNFRQARGYRKDRNRRPSKFGH
ncbi:polyribonucleotide nucleotidyltransferase [Candidatus Curtissbacteria bacterium RIFCSPLOWO2_01_FULL_41_18]|uniref:Polyribonucleotide nucleotidyltransferase n=1 Tax=Candidatus Curtissbacteria bacterium RIFCSPLOWO2_01_FULL_41_18 TaxID=1797727 RepID=A0A1F5HLN4_9BACT|nr:MAG: polyribonucleotide nucleotidyltransferase [Candidatus Curtissbacteria bacterium RIFCSPLOWO2_01_FULL_41_18]